MSNGEDTRNAVSTAATSPYGYRITAVTCQHGTPFAKIQVSRQQYTRAAMRSPANPHLEGHSIVWMGFMMQIVYTLVMASP